MEIKLQHQKTNKKEKKTLKKVETNVMSTRTNYKSEWNEISIIKEKNKQKTVETKLKTNVTSIIQLLHSIKQLKMINQS